MTKQYPHWGNNKQNISSQSFFSTITDHKEEKIPPIYDRLLSSINQLKENNKDSVLNF